VAGEQWDEAVQQLERARGLFPGWSEPGSAYHLLAEVHEKRKDRARAVASLSAVASRNESAFEENIRLSQWLTAAGDTQGAVQALERTVYITPFDATVHDSLAAAASRVKAHATTVRSRRALVALNPSDRAEALYQLARALADAGDAAGARREVLRALDIAPNFEKAQELLLTLRRPEGSP
jgi:tetratricopeptide (TPR) repeat protein